MSSPGQPLGEARQPGCRGLLAPFPCSPLRSPVLSERGSPSRSGQTGPLHGPVQVTNRSVCLLPGGRMRLSRDRSLLGRVLGGSFGSEQPWPPGSVLFGQEEIVCPSGGSVITFLRTTRQPLCLASGFTDTFQGPLVSALLAEMPKTPGARVPLSTEGRRLPARPLQVGTHILSSSGKIPATSQAAKLLPGPKATLEEHRCGRNLSVSISEPQIVPKSVQTPAHQNIPCRILRTASMVATKWPAGPPDLASVWPTS